LNESEIVDEASKAEVSENDLVNSVRDLESGALHDEVENEEEASSESDRGRLTPWHASSIASDGQEIVTDAWFDTNHHPVVPDLIVTPTVSVYQENVRACIEFLQIFLTLPFLLLVCTETN
jgi:hypothetical protein